MMPVSLGLKVLGAPWLLPEPTKIYMKSPRGLPGSGFRASGLKALVEELRGRACFRSRVSGQGLGFRVAISCRMFCP